MSKSIRTQVAIIGAGPAGLVLARLLDLAGIDSIVLERQSRDHIIHRVRAGVLEPGTVDVLNAVGIGDNVREGGKVQRQVEFRIDEKRHFLPYADLTGGHTTVVYGQERVVEDLIALRESIGRPPLFEAEVVGVRDLSTIQPIIEYTHNGSANELRCDFVAGCDGFRGISRTAVPAGSLKTYEHIYPVAWLAVLAGVPASVEDLVYAPGAQGLALHNPRGPQTSRMHLQVDPTEQIQKWTDERIWSELHLRLRAGNWQLQEGPILARELVELRSIVTEPMQAERLFLAGDAAHILPPTGAKGMNLAIADVVLLARALTVWFHDADDHFLQNYSRTALKHVWRVAHFAAWMTRLLHHWPNQDEFGEHEQRAELHRLFESETAARLLAEEFVGSSSSAQLDWLAAYTKREAE